MAALAIDVSQMGKHEGGQSCLSPPDMLIENNRFHSLVVLAITGLALHI